MVPNNPHGTTGGHVVVSEIVFVFDASFDRFLMDINK